MVEFTLFLFIVGGTKFWNNSLHAIAFSLNPVFTTVSYTGWSVEADDKLQDFIGE